MTLRVLDRIVPRKIRCLSSRDIYWLSLLSNGAGAKNLPGVKSEQVAKNRLRIIRWHMKVETTTQAVAEALRRGIIK